MSDCSRILVLEDNQGLRETVKELLEVAGFEVHVAENGKQGLEMLGDMEPPCMIFLDLMMPVMDGWEFLEELSERDDAMAEIPVTVLSAAADVFDVQTRYKVEVLRKPVDVDLLYAKVREHCRGDAADR